ncbi:MAG: PAS domain S-box protein, partial [Minisyncoccales bacterium]
MNKNRKDPVFKILLIEDNPGDIRLIKELLIQANNFEFELNSSRTLNEGLEKIQKNVYDIVLLDLSLPDCRGVETIKKAQKEVNIIPLIVLTGLEDENLARRTVKLGAHNYFVKGQITSNRLVRAIYHAIDRKKMLKKIHNLASFPSDNPSPVLRVNKERILYANSAARSLFGIRKGDNNPPCLEENINETFKKNDLVSSKINKKGKHYSFILKPIDQSHYINIHYINIYGMDITQLKKAEHAKEQSERRYLELFNHINDAIFIYDLKGNMLDFNKTAMNRLGYSREDLMKLTPMDFESPKFANKVPKKIEEIKRKGHLIMETAHQTKEGKVIPIELNSKIITYGGKEAILSVARDITERKNYEQNVKKSEKRYRDLFDNSPY